ncbi:MAG: glycosyltransferase family 4 protein [Burkholderiales bacterium]|jgi:glycosyltransferase involved in cell wall biosynthesis|nr:glycosyltransferase family 1 protein [Betaproteobacteria bacterium]
MERILIVTDAWLPQVNGVVKTLQNTAAELERQGHVVGFITPQDFHTLPCPTYPDIRLSLCSKGMVRRRIDAFAPDALHIATEGPLGWAARSVAVDRGWQFTTAYHTRFPEYVASRSPVPADWSYALLRRFHAPSAAVMVPTHSIIRDLEARRFANVVHWSRGVDHDIFSPEPAASRRFAGPPVFLYAGRVAVEKNIEAFLELDLPGEKWVAGGGPSLATLRRRYPDAHFLGMKTHAELADIYRQARVFVFPSRTDTFGLVLVEAMACGLPVAAYPVPGPLDVVGRSAAGVLDDDLGAACRRALELRPEDAIQHAAQFNWPAATAQFRKALVSTR